jgi:hypothetical protein
MTTKSTRNSLNPDRQGLAALAIAQFLLQFFKQYDTSKWVRFHDKLAQAWSAASDPARVHCLSGTTEELQELVPDLDTDRSPQAAIAQTASLAALNACQPLSPEFGRTLARSWEYFDEACEHASESDEDDKRYTDQVRSLRGLPVEEIKRRMQAINASPPSSNHARRARARFREFERELLKIVNNASLAPGECAVALRVLAEKTQV